MFYDFDIVVIEGKSSPTKTITYDNATLERVRHEHGQVARFRHQETADAAAAAPAAVRLLLEGLGFDFEANLSAMPAGQYEKSDDALRLEFIARMYQLLANRALLKALRRTAEKSVFDTTAFITCAITAKPSLRIVPRRPGRLRTRPLQGKCL